MQTVKFVYWEEDGAWIGYLREYPDYWTQGETLDDLKDHLRDLYHDLTSGELPPLAECCYVGDNLHTDAEAAKHTGMIGIWVNRKGLLAGTDVEVISSLRELKEVVELHNR